jgi:hypothetical protein
MFRDTPGNRKKLNAVAKELGAILYQPYRLSSGMLRVQNEDYGLLVDFLALVDGIRSFEGLRKRATPVQYGEATLLVASLNCAVRSKKAAGRPKDRGMLPILEQTLEERSIRRASRRSAATAALHRRKRLRHRGESGDAQMIRMLLALPPERRTHFLRRLIGYGGASCL